MPSSAAISLFVRPSATSARVCLCLSVKQARRELERLDFELTMLTLASYCPQVTGLELRKLSQNHFVSEGGEQDVGRHHDRRPIAQSPACWARAVRATLIRRSAPPHASRPPCLGCRSVPIWTRSCATRWRGSDAWREYKSRSEMPAPSLFR